MGVILAGCGIAIAFNHSAAADDEHHSAALGKPEWRGWLCILGGVSFSARGILRRISALTYLGDPS
jgi:hypothetical protein